MYSVCPGYKHGGAFILLTFEYTSRCCYGRNNRPSDKLGEVDVVVMFILKLVNKLLAEWILWSCHICWVHGCSLGWELQSFGLVVDGSTLTNPDPDVGAVHHIPPVTHVFPNVCILTYVFLAGNNGFNTPKRRRILIYSNTRKSWNLRKTEYIYSKANTFLNFIITYARWI